MKFILLLVAFASSIFLYGQQVIKGEVFTDLEKRTPISNVLIYLLETEQNTISDEQGRFEFLGKFPNQVQLRVVKNGFETKVLRVDLSESNKLQITLLEKHIELEEITISSGIAVQQQKNPFHIETRKLSDLSGIANVNLGEAIAKIPGVYQASLGNGISKPVIRGLQGMRIVTLINGLRIEGQQWGGDHGMGLSELGIGTVEVIKGPASLLYGADALGGVLYFSDEPYAAANKRSLNINSMFQSNTLGGSVRMLYKQSTSKVRWLIGVSHANHADFQLPNGLYAKNSRFDETVVKSALSFNAKKSVHHLRYTYNFSVTGIPGHTHDSLAVFSDFQVQEQKRKYELPAQFFSNHYFSSDNKWFLGKNELHVFLGATSNQLIEYDEKVTIPSLSMTLNNLLSSVKWHRKWNNQLKSISGFQGMFQQNTNAQNASDRLIPNAQTIDNGIFSNWIFEHNTWIFQGGFRYDLRILNSLEAFNGNEKINSKFGSPNAAFGAVYSNSKFTFRSNLSTGFRAPHSTELLANGFHHGALRYEIGDVNLKPEKSTQLDLTFEMKDEHVAMVINPFANAITDYIYLQPIDSLVDGIPVFEYRQLSRVLFYGTDLAFHYHPHFAHNLHLESGFSFVSTYTLTDSSVSLIPPARFNTTIRYSIDFGKKIQLKDVLINYTYMAPQDKVAYNERVSADYHLLNASLSILLNFKAPITFNIGCKNLLNYNFIDHLSRLKNIEMPAPGRYYYVSLNFNINQQINQKK
jgi:iron complex outermembrane receptor protein